MKYRGSFKSENGTETAFQVETSCSVQEDLERGLQFIAQSVRSFYPEAGKAMSEQLEKDKLTIEQEAALGISLRAYLTEMLGLHAAREILSMSSQEKEQRYIIIDGRQGPTGKSTLCKVLRKHGYKVLEMHEQKYIRLDAELQCKIADFSDLII